MCQQTVEKEKEEEARPCLTTVNTTGVLVKYFYVVLDVVFIDGLYLVYQKSMRWSYGNVGPNAQI